VKKHLILYSVLGVMALSAVLFMHTLVRAAFSAPDDAGIYSASVMVPASDIPTAFASVSTTTATTTATTTSTVASTSIPSNYPSRLLIPSLNIDANVQKVGINAKGAMGTPNNFTDVAWYKYGVIPGNIGSAVIDGHVDNGLALAGVFKHLVDIKPGDDIYVVNEAGNKIHFTVTTVDTYNYKFVPVEDIFNNQNGSHLRLITCGGTWVPSGRTYDERLVVTAVLDNN
jgi:sortase (surface protein transpeptidase)